MDRSDFRSHHRLRLPAGTRRHLCLAPPAIDRIGQLEYVEVVLPGNRLQFLLVPLRQEVGENEGHGWLPGELREGGEGGPKIGLLAFWFAGEERFHDTAGVEAPLGRTNEHLDLIAEEDESDPIVVLDGGQGDHGGEFDQGFSFGAAGIAQD